MRSNMTASLGWPPWCGGDQRPKCCTKRSPETLRRGTSSSRTTATFSGGWPGAIDWTTPRPLMSSRPCGCSSLPTADRSETPKASPPGWQRQRDARPSVGSLTRSGSSRPNSKIGRPTNLPAQTSGSSTRKSPQPRWRRSTGWCRAADDFSPCCAKSRPRATAKSRLSSAFPSDRSGRHGNGVLRVCERR